MTNKNNSVEEMMEASGFTRLNLSQAVTEEEKDEIVEELREEFTRILTTSRTELIQEIREKIPTLRESQNCGKCYSCEMASPCEIRFADREVNQTLFEVLTMLDELEGNK